MRCTQISILPAERLPQISLAGPAPVGVQAPVSDAGVAPVVVVALHQLIEPLGEALDVDTALLASCSGLLTLEPADKVQVLSREAMLEGRLDVRRNRPIRAAVVAVGSTGDERVGFDDAHTDHALVASKPFRQLRNTRPQLNHTGGELGMCHDGIAAEARASARPGRFRVGNRQIADHAMLPFSGVRIADN
jgi:hypothetical protein